LHVCTYVGRQFLPLKACCWPWPRSPRPKRRPQRWRDSETSFSPFFIFFANRVSDARNAFVLVGFFGWGFSESWPKPVWELQLWFSADKMTEWSLPSFFFWSAAWSQVSLSRNCTPIRVARFFSVYGTKNRNNVPNEHKRYHIVIKYPKCP
jgi:hypothetical protein